MAVSTLTAIEHQVLPVGLGGATLSHAEVGRLAALNQKRPGFCIQGHHSVRLAQFVGLVNLGGRILEVLPKIGEQADLARARGTLLRLLRWTYDLPALVGEGVEHDLKHSQLLDVFVLAYLRSLVPLVKVGLVRRYRTMEEDLGVVRGRLLLQRQIAVHAMRVDRVACRFDELTINNPWNQALKAGLLAVRPYVRGLDAERLWLELAAAFVDVSAPQDGVSLHARLVSNRQVSHYKAALHWVGWILRLLSPSIRAGSNEAPELLFDMNRLFEASVTSKLRRNATIAGLNLHPQSMGQHLAQLKSDDRQKFFRLRPDMILCCGEEVLAIADTKWARLEMDTSGRLIPKDTHVYQLHAYAAAYRCLEVVLIYPRHDGLEGAHPSAFQFQGWGEFRPALHVVSVDVSRDDMPFEAVLDGSAIGRITS